MPGSILMGPTVLEHSVDEEPANQGLNEEYFSRLYEWRLNMKSMSVIEKYLTGAGIDMEFPVINDKYVGLNHKYAYAQVVDFQGSLAGGCGIGMFLSKYCSYLKRMQYKIEQKFI